MQEYYIILFVLIFKRALLWSFVYEEDITVLNVKI